MNPFRLEIITPQRLAFAEDVTSVSVPTVDGRIMVLAHHAQLFTALTQGEIKIVQGGNEYFLVIGGGFMEVTPDGASILVSRAVHAHELNAAEIEKAKGAAEATLAGAAKGIERQQAMELLRRSVIERKILERMSSRKTTPYTPTIS